eukprot:gene379-477_t
MYKLCFFVPESHLEVVKKAVFAVGAGKIGNYGCCSWQTKGQGQFLPLENSKPYIGQVGQVETVDEWKVELVVENNLLKETIKALKSAHPYETPAYDVFEMVDI